MLTNRLFIVLLDSKFPCDNEKVDDCTGESPCRNCGGWL